jgi:dihydrofolate reductase
MQITVDGYIEDPEGRIDWVESWEDEYDLLDRVDLAVLGSGMYSIYEQYWTAALNPKGKLPFSGKEPTPGEAAYANWAARTPHIVVSRKPLNVNWKNTRVVSDLEEVRELKQKTGKDIYMQLGAQS